MVSLRPGVAGEARGIVRFAIRWIAALALLQVACAFGEDALDQWLARQAGMRAWTAEFKQTRSLAVLKDPLIANGRVWFAEPNRFRWELGQPAQTLAIRGTNDLVVLYPRLKRAERISLRAQRGPLREALALLETGFPRSRAELTDRFEIRSLRPLEAGRWRLALQPRSAEARRFMESVTLDFAVAEPGPSSTELRFADGTVLRNDFSRPQVNPELAGDWFATEIPGDYKSTTIP
jgi:outer membrane lipoprotein-sorting protein